MVRKILLLAGVALSVPAFAYNAKASAQPVDQARADISVIRMKDQAPVKVSMDGSVRNMPKKAPAANVQWRRPAGQFWGTGYSPRTNILGYLYTPLVLRPWTEYTFENISNVQGTPTWTITSFDYNEGAYMESFSDATDVKASWGLGEMCEVPMLSYPNLQPYAEQYDGMELSQLKTQFLCVNNDIEGLFENPMLVSSHYWSTTTRNPSRRPLVFYNGADVYPGQDPECGYWFGTNNSGINAMATRFEKPDQPYLLNAVYYYYQYFTDIKNEIPMKAYVFKTLDDAKMVQINDSVTKERLELGELIATSESFIPKAVSSENDFQNAVKFEFFEVNPVTGAKTAISLEIEDDITVIVTGFNGDPGEGGLLTTFASEDTYDEGYGNLGFLGTLEEDEEGNISYQLSSLSTCFASAEEPMNNTTVGVLADVSYPWLIPAMIEQPNDVLLPNDGQTSDTVQGLEYYLYFMSTSMTEDYDVTFNGEEECDWLEIVDVYDEMGVTEDDEEYFTGVTGLLFQAAPNPEDVSRTCVVKVTIPAASYEITFRQGTNNDNAVEIVGVDSNAQYFDLQGRRVANPEKGLYIQKSGNKARKVIL